MLRPALPLFALAALFPLFTAPPVEAQAPALEPRYGGGFEAMIFVGNPRVIRDGLGIGLRGRVSFPLNADFSAAADAGLIGFVLAGREEALWIFNPQVSGILTLPAIGQSRYLIAGFGWAVPMGGARPGDNGVNRPAGGPTIHGGIGWVIPLQDISLFIEFNPALVIDRDRTTIALPLRGGVIF